MIKTLILLFISWFAFWGLYSFYLSPKGYKTERSAILSPILFLAFSQLYLLISQRQYDTFWKINIVFSILLFILSVLIKNRQIGRIINSFSQMTWVYCLYRIVGKDVLLIGTIFFVGHIPILILRKLKQTTRLIILIGSLFGGILFGLVINYFPDIVSFFLIGFIHYSFYTLIRPLDTKNGWGVVE